MMEVLQEVLQESEIDCLRNEICRLRQENENLFKENAEYKLFRNREREVLNAILILCEAVLD